MADDLSSANRSTSDLGSISAHSSHRPVLRWLRALAWMRWRVFINRLRAAQRRDLWTRLGSWLEPIIWTATVLVMVPGFASVGLAGGFLGFLLATKPDESSVFFFLLRFFLAGGTLAILVMAVSFGGRGGGADESGRWKLLPLDPRWLHALRWLSSLADPWMAAAAMGWLGLTIGLLVGGAWIASLVAGVAGVLWLLSLAGLEQWLLAAIQGLLRDRKRAETVGLIAILALIAISLLPTLFLEHTPKDFPVELTSLLWWLNLPAELALTALGESIHAPLSATWMVAAPLLTLALLTTWIFLRSGRAHDRALFASAEGGTRRRGPTEKRHELARPAWLRGPVSAVAVAQLRSLLRTAPGKLNLLQGVLWIAICVLLFLPQDKFASWSESLNSMLPSMLLVVAAAMSSLGFTQLVFNQFMLDGAGITLSCLVPLSSRDLLRGKAVAWVALHLVALLLAAVLLVVLDRPSPAPFLRGLALATGGTVAAVVFVTPFAVILSAWLPNKVDLRRPFASNQPHVLAVFAGFGLIPMVWSLPAITLVVEFLRGEASPWTFPLLAFWIALAFTVARLLEPLAIEIWEKRREAVLMASQGR